MTLKLERLHLNVQTSNGPFAAQLIFRDGLNVIHADNSMGKSTCIQAIIYALGLERMLGPKALVPLPPAMTSILEDEEGAHHQVLESDVLLEISNQDGSRLTIKRGVKGNRDTRLISTWNGPKLSQPEVFAASQDYFVRDPGSAVREAGFHHYLTEFLGWSLPQVTRTNGGECPLYLEGIFPLFLVEQKHGWSGIQANLPTYLGIRELAKRALEFTLDLDAASIQAEKLAVAQEEVELRQQWREAVIRMQSGLGESNARVRSFPKEPVAGWPPSPEPSLEALIVADWVPIKDAIAGARDERATLREASLVTSDNAAPSAREELANRLEELFQVDSAATMMLDELEKEKAQLRAVDRRVSALDEDLRRNLDAEKLRGFGSVAGWQLTHDTCPTCQQHIADTLLVQLETPEVMGLSENIDFIRSQLDTFRRIRQTGETSISEKAQRLTVLRRHVEDVQNEIRTLKQTLTNASGAPVLSGLKRELALDALIAALGRADQRYASDMSTFEKLADLWRAHLGRRKALPSEELSNEDEEKLRKLESLVEEQLRLYGFRSVPPDSISISRDNYRPTRDGFNLGFDLSASDNIRIIWAYLQSLLELARTYPISHPGFLIFDEPRQQEAKEVSFANLLSRAAASAANNQQVIFATSEKWEKLSEMVSGLSLNILKFDGRILTKQ